MPAERDEMEPPKAAVKTLVCDTAERPQEALELAVAAGGRLDVHGPAHPFASLSAPHGQRTSERSVSHRPAKCEQSHSIMAVCSSACCGVAPCTSFTRCLKRFEL